MIGIGRSVQIVGDPQAAMKFAADMVAHMKAWPGVRRAICWQSLGGPAGSLVFWMEVDNLAAADALNSAVMEDKAYWTKVADARGKGLFNAANMQDMMMRQLA